MNRHLATIVVVSGLVFSAGCGDDKETDTTTPATESNTVASTVSDRTIAGTIIFDGDVGSGVIIIVANLVGSNGPPLYSAVLDAAGPYSLTGVEDGEYIITAFLDAADDRGPPAADEPQGFYDANADGTPDSVIVAGGVGLTEIDITLA